jgi:hypothetical protein
MFLISGRVRPFFGRDYNYRDYYNGLKNITDSEITDEELQE